MIETARLRLRPLSTNDVDDVLSLQAAPEVSRFMGRYDRAVLLERLELNERAFRERGHGLVAIIERASGRFVGRIGLRYWPQFDETEVGWALRPEDWGKGYATEAAQACIDWGFREFDFPYLTAMIQPANVRSIRVAERLGMTQLRRDVLLDIPVIVYCLPSPRGPAAHP